MKTSLAHLLTNRPAPFNSPAFPQAGEFQPSLLTPAAESTLRLLQLHDTSTDFYLNAFLRVLQTQPDLWTLLASDRVATLSMESYRPALPQASMCQLVHDKTEPAAVVRRSREWPVEFTIKVITPGGPAHIQVGEQSWTSVPAHITGTDLHIEWPAETGVTGVARREAGWSGVEGFEILHEPVLFPFVELHRAVVHHEDVATVLAQAGALDAFLNSVSPVRCAALLAASLIRTHPQFE